MDFLKYEEDLFSPDIDWNYLSQIYPPPEKLYKYQSFYKNENTQNPYWLDNLNGEFHMSLARDFEDTNDCKPHINMKIVREILEDYLKQFVQEKNRIEEIKKVLDEELVEDRIIHIEKNFQEGIRIGCFTDSPYNEQMWEKYSDNNRGYCIEYDSKRHDLFTTSTLPVLYSQDQYDLSLPYVSSIILEAVRKKDGKSHEEMIKDYDKFYKRILKMTYVPVFIKQEKWEFEREYRMFLLKHRNTIQGMITMDESLDENKNINLSDSIIGIYLGDNFTQNKDYNNILSEIKEIAQSKNITVYQKKGNLAERIIL